MTAAEFRREFERWLALLTYCMQLKDTGGAERCERELTRLSEAGARGLTTPTPNGG